MVVVPRLGRDTVSHPEAGRKRPRRSRWNSSNSIARGGPSPKRTWSPSPERHLPPSTAEILDIPRERAGEVLEHILHKLHVEPVLIMPIGRWRSVFDVVTPALADNEQWMGIDSEATIELNTRDPLLFELRDLHLLRSVVETVLKHSETLDQGISIAAIQAPILVEVEPAGGVLLTIGNEGLADEVRAVGQAFMEA